MYKQYIILIHVPFDISICIGVLHRLSNLEGANQLVAGIFLRIRCNVVTIAYKFID